MSNVKPSCAKKQFCGNMHHTDEVIRDVLGGFVNFQITGTDVHAGVIDGSMMAADYSPSLDDNGLPCTNPDGTFMITIETDNATYYVTLADGSDFIITPTQSHAYLGRWYPAKLLSVNLGSTGYFSVGY